MGKHRKPGFPSLKEPKHKRKSEDGEDNEMTTPLLPLLLAVIVGAGLFYAGAKDAFR